jgi:hypothetical protein
MPIAVAANEREQMDTARRAAWRLEDGAARLHDKARRIEEASQALRIEAARPPRKLPKRRTAC